MSVCGSCGDSSVEVVEYNGEEQSVCTSCGVVQESGSFSTEAEKSTVYVDQRNVLFVNQNAPTGIQRKAKIVYSNGQKEGFAKITVLSSQFRLTGEMKNQAFDMFKRGISSKGLVMCRIKKKSLIAGCCVYTVMRQHNWPVTVSHICNALGCSREEFSQPYLQLLKALGITVTSVAIEDLVDTYLNECKALDISEREVLKSRVHSVLQICKDSYLSAGRMQRPVLLSALHICWQSINPKRSKISFSAFCDKMGFTYQIQAYRRRSEVVNVLCALGNQIPWFEANHVTVRNLFKYLEDILRYSNTLLSDLCDKQGCIRKFHERPKAVCTERPLELDINEKEIESYIRSKEEVRLIQKMNCMFESAENS